MGPNVYLTQKYIQKRMIGAGAGMVGNEKHGDIYLFVLLNSHDETGKCLDCFYHLNVISNHFVFYYIS